MILVYPMLVSKSVSPNIIPGICKVMERNIIIYKMDEVVKYLNSSAQSLRNHKLVSDGKRLYLKEGKLGVDHPPEKKPLKSDTHNTTVNVNIPASKGDKKPSGTSVKIDQPNSQSITVEPTWVKIDIKNKNVEMTQILGIKVVAFPVKSDATLAELMLSDKSMGILKTLAVSLSRKFQKSMWNAWYSSAGIIPFLGRGTVSGDVKRDILIARTEFRDKIISCVNIMDLNNDFFKSAGGINKLYKLGWNDFITTDDVNKRAYFCLKSFKGMCNTIQYQFIYGALNQSQVYDSLEDVRKSSSPFFKLKTKASNLITENYINAKLEKFRS